MNHNDCIELLRPCFADRRTILIGGPVVAMVSLAKQLLQAGARRPFILGGSRGTGELPTDDVAEWFSLEQSAAGIMNGFRLYEDTLRDLPADACEAIDRYDPDGSALVIGTIILSDVPEVHRRRRFAYRPPAWAALEDKIAIDAVWDAAGVPRASSEIVPATLEALESAARRLDRGIGTVWAGDARDGIHGGATHTRWVRNETQARNAARFLAAACDRVRVMPFLEGIPCSIHGVVLPDGVATFRPVELLTLRRPGSSELLYAGAATSWDPSADDREDMRALARRMGEHLRATVGYRGAFTLDGVMTSDGFRPTELNPRIGAGIFKLSISLGDFPLELLLLTVVETDLALDAKTFEELIVNAADANRHSVAICVLDGDRTETETHYFAFDRDGMRRVESEEESDGSFLIGPSNAGGFLRFVPKQERIPTGPSFAPWIVRAFAFIDRELDLGIGTVEAARTVR